MYLSIQKKFAERAAVCGRDEESLAPPRTLPWYPEENAWHLSVGRRELRKSSSLGPFHELLVQESATGNVTRQEAVSMLPPLFLDVHPDHKVR